MISIISHENIRYDVIHNKLIKDAEMLILILIYTILFCIFMSFNYWLYFFIFQLHFFL